ncbi:MAG: glycosyltransferase family 2 protein [Verrucomicrobia bacterium]|nr:glycosyltransferase family 2 protein [Verrucomicrobiota bacterium]
MSKLDLSVVIPVYNSGAIFPELYTRLTTELSSRVDSFEVIAVIDGCVDNSYDVVAAHCDKDPRVKLIELSRNFGHQNAVTAGLDAASGELVAIIDDDLEDPPEVLVQLMEKLDEGYDVVYGIRRKRKRSWLYRFLFSAFYRLLDRMVEMKVPHDTGDFCVMRREVADTIKEMPESNRYLRGMRTWVGFRQTGLEYERSARFSGQTGYSLSKYFHLALDAIFSFSNKPLVSVSIGGGVISLVSLILGARLVLLRSMGRIPEVPGWASLFVAVTFLAGVQLFCLGIIGIYLCRVYDEVKRRPKYVVNRTVGFGGDDS